MRLDCHGIALEILQENPEVRTIDVYRALNTMMVGYRLGIVRRDRSSAQLSRAASEIIKRIEQASDEDIRTKTWVDFAVDLVDPAELTFTPQEHAYFNTFRRLLSNPQMAAVRISPDSIRSIEKTMQMGTPESPERTNAICGNIRLLLAQAVRQKFVNLFYLGNSRLSTPDSPLHDDGLDQVKSEINPTTLALEKLLENRHDTQ